MTQQNSDQPKLQFSTQNKIRINPCCNFPHKTNFDSTYIAIVLTQQNSGQPTLQFFTKNKLQINLRCNSPQNKIRINLCWTLAHKTNSDQPMLQFSTQNKIRETCPRM